MPIHRHIEQIDQKQSSSDRMVYLSAARRELTEEVKINSPYYERVVALINDNTTEVDKVHFGILHIWDLVYPNVERKEKKITDISFMEISKLIKIYPNFETWSNIAIEIIQRKDFPVYYKMSKKNNYLKN
jgi:predicted NUDIX family phosphoesterase